MQVFYTVATIRFFRQCGPVQSTLVVHHTISSAMPLFNQNFETRQWHWLQAAAKEAKKLPGWSYETTSIALYELV